MKRKCWQDFLKSVNLKTSSATVWKKINSINKKLFTTSPSYQLIHNTDSITIVFVLSLLTQSSDYLAYTNEENLSNLYFNSSFSDYEAHNSLISINKLKRAIRNMKSSSGSECVYIFQKVSNPAINLLLNAFNSIWTSFSFPKICKIAKIIPILKPKNPMLVNNYHLISLTSVTWKVFETIIINNQLLWLLESRQLLTNVQCRFTAGRSSVTRVFKGLYTKLFCNNKHHVLAIFFDLEKGFRLNSDE